MGLSLGSYVGLQLLSESPSIVGRVIFSGLHVLPMPNKWLMSLMSYLLAPLVQSDLMIRLNAKALKIPKEQFGEYRHSFKQMPIRTFLNASRDANNFKMPDNTDSLSTPALIVAGEHEHRLIHQSQKALIEVMDNAKSYIAPNVGHGWNSEAPELFAEMVHAWIQDQPLPEKLQPVL